MDACLKCPSKCCVRDLSLWSELHFFPHEVARGLHLRFPHVRLVVDGVELYVMDLQADCPYFRGGRCMLYGTGDMPLDCRIYPAVPTLDGDVAIDYEGCPMAKLFDNEEYRCKVLELVKPHMPSREWLTAYWRV